MRGGGRAQSFGRRGCLLLVVCTGVGRRGRLEDPFQHREAPSDRHEGGIVGRPVSVDGFLGRIGMQSIFAARGVRSAGCRPTYRGGGFDRAVGDSELLGGRLVIFLAHFWFKMGTI